MTALSVVPVATLTGHTGPVRSVVVPLPDGRVRLATASPTVTQLMNLPPQPPTTPPGPELPDPVPTEPLAGEGH